MFVKQVRIAYLFQSIISSKGITSESAIITGMQPAAIDSNKTLCPSLAPLITKQKVDICKCKTEKKFRIINFITFLFEQVKNKNSPVKHPDTYIQLVLNNEQLLLMDYCSNTAPVIKYLWDILFLTLSDPARIRYSNWSATPWLATTLKYKKLQLLFYPHNWVSKELLLDQGDNLVRVTLLFRFSTIGLYTGKLTSNPLR